MENIHRYNARQNENGNNMWVKEVQAVWSFSYIVLLFPDRIIEDIKVAKFPLRKVFAADNLIGKCVHSKEKKERDNKSVCF